MPPYSWATTSVFLKASSNEVFPWSTCPITVTIGDLGFKLLLSLLTNFWMLKSGFFSLIGILPNSFTRYSAVSASIVWFIVATTPMPKRCLIILLVWMAILFESSFILIVSGIFISRIIFLVSIFLSSEFWFFFSLSRARITDAKLLSLPSITSSVKAFDKVSLYSLLEVVILFLLKLPFFSAKLYSFGFLNLFVALSSAIFLISIFLFIVGFLGAKLLFDFVLSWKPDVGLFTLSLRP